MKYSQLGTTNLKVSKICLGTMTFGEQNTEKEGHEQLDYAIDQGVNFIDTAELYSIPANPKTQGNTDRIIGTWLKGRKDRDKLIIASKVAGPSPGLTFIRENLGFSRDAVREAVNKGLERLQTDYIDVYQLHWPERKSNFFSTLGYVHHENDPWEDNFLEVLHTLDEIVKEGKIRHVGISNETAWGAMRYLSLADKHDLPRMVSIQNPYNLLNRSYEVGLAEVSIREKCGLLAYSPMAFGVLSGKYLKGKDLERDRINRFPQYARYSSENSTNAVIQYWNIAEKYGMTLAEMSLAFINTRSFVTANIIGATKMEQLKENIGSINVDLSAECIKEIEEVHKVISNPAP